MLRLSALDTWRRPSSGRGAWPASGCGERSGGPGPQGRSGSSCTPTPAPTRAAGRAQEGGWGTRPGLPQS